MRRSLLFAATVCFASLAANAFEIEPLTLPGQAQPSIVAEGDRGFILTHIDKSETEAQLRFATLDRDGTVQRHDEIASGNDWFVNWADFPSLMVAENGDWVSFFLRKIDPAKPYAYAIDTVRSTDRGASWSKPLRIHDDGTATEHGFVSLLPDGDDRVLAVWLDGRRSAAQDHDGHSDAITTLRSAVLRRDGTIGEAKELDELTCDCCTTDALRFDDAPLVVYRNRTEAQIRDIGFVQRGQHGWSDPALVHADDWLMPGCPVNGPALTTHGDHALAVWPTLVQGAYRVRMARRDEGGWQQLPELEAHADLQGRVDAAPWVDGSALVSWIGVGERGSVLRLAEIDTAGKVRQRVDVDELPVGRSTGMPRLAAHGDRAVLVWTDPDVRGGKVRGVLIRPSAKALAASLRQGD